MAIANYADRLFAANVAFTARVAAPPENLISTRSMLARDVEFAAASGINVGYVDDAAPIRRVVPGVQQPRDGARAFGRTYDTVADAITLELTRREFADDSSGRVARMLAAFAARDILEEAMWLGIDANVLGVDGVPLFSATHPHGPGGSTQSNTTANALTYATYNAAKAAMRGLRKESGRFLDVEPTHLFVGPTLERTAKEVVGADRPVAYSGTAQDATTGIVAATSIRNVYEGDVTVVVTPAVTGSKWYLAALGGEMRPWAVGGSAPLAITPREDDETVRDLDVMIWQVKQDHAMGPANWQAIYGGGIA